MNRIKIGEIEIGNGAPCFVIAEIGSNHDRSLAQAKHLIDGAIHAGANAVKFQSFLAEKMNVCHDPDFDIVKSIEMPPEWHAELAGYCAEKRTLFLSTPFDLPTVDILEQVKMTAYKIASGDITYYPLLKRVAQTGKPVILSTGKSDLKDIDAACDCLRAAGCRDLILLHCVATYPTSPEEVNLRVIESMKKRYGVPVGFSDHTMSTVIPAFAVCGGSDLIEKHVTLDKKLPGPDHSYALDLGEFEEMVRLIRLAETTRGHHEKTLSLSERKRALTGRRALFATMDIAPGARLTEAMLSCLRPQMTETNLPASLFYDVLGKTVRRQVKKNSSLTRKDLEI